MKNKPTPFEEYYQDKLDKDTLSQEEFSKMLTDYFLGFSYYIADPVGGAQARRIILQDIMKAFPQKHRKISSDQRWLDDYKSRLLQREQRKS